MVFKWLINMSFNLNNVINNLLSCDTQLVFKQKGIVRHEGSKKTGGYVLSHTKAKNKKRPTN